MLALTVPLADVKLVVCSEVVVFIGPVVSFLDFVLTAAVFGVASPVDDGPEVELEWGCNCGWGCCCGCSCGRVDELCTSATTASGVSSSDKSSITSPGGGGATLGLDGFIC